MRSLLAKEYVSLDRSGNLEAVRSQFDAVINALPTQIHPTERELYLDAILADLEDCEAAPWTTWPPDVYILALTAIKTLGRNPVGSETLLTLPHFQTLLHHTSLPFSTSPSPFSNPPPHPTSPPALETMKILANLLVLHPSAREVFHNLRGARAIARALAGKDGDGDWDDGESSSEDDMDRLFLLGRIGFLVTLERPDAVGIMVDKEDVVESLVYYVASISTLPGNFAALSEVLKFINNIIRFYPFKGKSSSNGDEPWVDRFDSFLDANLALLHNIPYTDLAPPLSHTIHVLLSIPFTSRLLPIWHSVPIPDPPSPSALSSSSSVKALFNRISHISTNASSGIISRSRTSSDSGSTRTKSPSPPPMQGKTRVPRLYTLPPKTTEPTALPARILGILGRFCERNVPWPKGPDGVEKGLVLDEMLPPAMLLLARAATGSESMRTFLKDALLPTDLNRSNEAGPLEKRKGLLGTILRLMGCTNHPQCRDTAGELLWSICGEDASTLTAEIGYGNAAGLLFQKGISGPPPGKIVEIVDKPLPSPTLDPTTTNTNSTTPRNPITGIRDTDDDTDPLAGMTEAEKEREAERLFTLFDKLDKNPVVSTQGPDGSRKGLKEVMQDKYVEVDKGWAEKERREVQEEEEREEEEAMKDMAAYKARTGRR